jgi:hypothetical protein
MTTLSNVIIRVEAKKVYKEQAKKVPKRQRMPFNEFFKKYKKMRLGNLQQEEAHNHEHEHDAKEDFDFNEFVKTTEINNETLEVEEDIDSEEETPRVANEELQKLVKDAEDLKTSGDELNKELDELGIK